MNPCLSCEIFETIKEMINIKKCFFSSPEVHSLLFVGYDFSELDDVFVFQLP